MQAAVDVHTVIDPTFDEFLIVVALCAALIVISFVVFYESMRYAWRRLSKIPHRPRLTIHLGVLMAFLCHTLCVWMYAMLYWFLVDYLHFGNLQGAFEHGHLLSYVYFSVVTYSSVGYGDIVPTGPLRIIAGVEAVNGLMLIGWSTTYTYFAAERYMAHERALQVQEARQQWENPDLTEL